MAVKENCQFYMKLNLFSFEVFQVDLRKIFRGRFEEQGIGQKLDR